MLRHLKSATEAVHNWARPHCEKCGKRAFPHKHCSLCESVCPTNRSDELKRNYSEHGKHDQGIASAEFVCDTCFQGKELTKCAKTGVVFFRRDDRVGDYFGSQMLQNLSPHHPSSRLRGSLCEEGLALISREHQELQNRCRNWAGCTKQDYLRGYRIVKELGLIREDGQHDDPAEVEEALKLHCLQIGGSGLVKFFWDKHIRHHEEKYVAGHGKNGNPYYQTRRSTTADFSGHAVAVVAEAASVSAKTRRNDNGGGGGGGDGRDPQGPRPSGPAVGTEAFYAQVLGLNGKCTKEEIKSAYRKLIAEYHPDKVSHLGTELRELASTKAKALNGAYEFFSKKYNI